MRKDSNIIIRTSKEKKSQYKKVCNKKDTTASKDINKYIDNEINIHLLSSEELKKWI